MLMDMIFNLTPESKLKKRIHFNKFMLSIHNRIHELKETTDSHHDEPFQVLAKQIISEVYYSNLINEKFMKKFQSNF